MKLTLQQRKGFVFVHTRESSRFSYPGHRNQLAPMLKIDFTGSLARSGLLVLIPTALIPRFDLRVFLQPEDVEIPRFPPFLLLLSSLFLVSLFAQSCSA